MIHLPLTGFEGWRAENSKGGPRVKEYSLIFTGITTTIPWGPCSPIPQSPLPDSLTLLPPPAYLPHPRNQFKKSSTNGTICFVSAPSPGFSSGWWLRWGWGQEQGSVVLFGGLVQFYHFTTKMQGLVKPPFPYHLRPSSPHFRLFLSLSLSR